MDIAARPWFAPIFDYSTDLPPSLSSLLGEKNPGRKANEVDERDSDESLLPRVSSKEWN